MTAVRLAGFARLAWFATAFAFCVIVFGAFVRLSNAGLSCPDWPTCYGKLTWPTHQVDIAAANQNFPQRPVESNKAWREQGHRFLAGGLVLTTFFLAGWAIRRRRDLAGLMWVPLAAAVFIVFQAALGMWTVTWLLKPIVVLAHLLGGLTTFSLLAYTAIRASDPPSLYGDGGPKLRRLVIVGIVLLACQIALGGWTSANYAALACGTDFPKCLDQWWPGTDFREAFVLWRGVGVNYEGGVLDGAARTAIQMTHRIGAVLVFGHLLMLSIFALRRHIALGAWVAGLLLLQIGLGISNVVYALPLPVATAHNAVAAALLFTLLMLLARLRPDQSQ